ncbi:class I SAM-dependent methyltransferase [Ktedonosporobacter rubrisoli]|uniref:Class I SAM-dependent methyltransferase n=1 Tax=Ktedonosporobacter rubrisoli TaxID=2509675 RepID=A0A4P6JVG5_KTERU|nr:class I SAM-dependent methyltransferase [Ktedonosporobacter rubrisoli]QBD79659.1 class I SAM-dependent methyltransferase [Ktedonosporobacter rubrisoli]
MISSNSSAHRPKYPRLIPLSTSPTSFSLSNLSPNFSPVGPKGEVERTQHLGELLSDTLPDLLVDCQDFHRVLDVASGKGSWALNIARNYPKLWVLGIDRHAQYVEQANAIAVNEGLPNIEFLVKDISEVKDAGYQQRLFDLVHLQFIVGELMPAQLPIFTQTLVELCKPGGYIVWTEAEIPITNSPACERFSALLSKSLHYGRRAFNPGVALGITPLMSSWLRALHCHVVRDIAYPIDLSAGTTMRPRFLYYIHDLGLQMRSFVLNTGICQPEEYDKLFDEALRDIQSLTFAAVCYIRALVCSPLDFKAAAIAGVVAAQKQA